MPDNSTKPKGCHYVYWGCNAFSACGEVGSVTSRHEFVTCASCKTSQAYRNHVMQRELAFDGNFMEWQEALKHKFFKNETTND